MQNFSKIFPFLDSTTIKETNERNSLKMIKLSMPSALNAMLKLMLKTDDLIALQSHSIVEI